MDSALHRAAQKCMHTRLLWVTIRLLRRSICQTSAGGCMLYTVPYYLVPLIPRPTSDCELPVAGGLHRGW